MDEFISAIELILSSTFFTLNDKIYKQTLLISDNSGYNIARSGGKSAKINVNIPFYFRYVDDIILAAPLDQASNILDTFNSFQ